ncbi:MAG TPA: OsmC family protein [Candidatus Limnocylindrales bacterium]|nr:OsmC family protein [Candidatus Limnocylindrales bacterium]
MPIRTTTLELDGDQLRFAGRTGSGHLVILDSAAGDAGPRPSELIPLAIAGCTAMDVISILRKKRQDIRRYVVDAVGVQDDDHPNAFSRLDVRHRVEGPAIDPVAVRRAIELSATNYCAVGATLASGRVEIRHRFVVGDTATGAETTDDAIVIGPWRPQPVPEPVPAG